MINDIITAMEKECAVAEFQFDKANMLFEMVEKNHEMMYQEASVMVYANDRSYEDLCALYEAADAETNEKKGGILSSLIDAVVGIFTAIGNMFSKLINAITGNAEAVPDTAKVSQDDADTLNSVEEFSNKTGSIVGKFVNIKTIGGAVASALGILGGCKLVSVLKNRKENAKNGNTTEQKTVTMNGKEVAEKIKIIPTLTKTVGNLAGKVKGLFSKPKNGSGETAGNENNDGSEKTNVLFNLLKDIGQGLKDFGKRISGIFKLPFKGKDGKWTFRKDEGAAEPKTGEPASGTKPEDQPKQS